MVCVVDERVGMDATAAVVDCLKLASDQDLKTLRSLTCGNAYCRELCPSFATWFELAIVAERRRRLHRKHEYPNLDFGSFPVAELAGAGVIAAELTGILGLARNTVCTELFIRVLKLLVVQLADRSVESYLASVAESPEGETVAERS